ncbi:hypothetical protein U9M48_023285 [Paspalum notatum var. saurae]|uniref:Uncharacterized protein n=1 Tax=Paspalum notatum var. saurae TaxID=547442 RepID=A0AAQ3TNR6_PASNO
MAPKSVRLRAQTTRAPVGSGYHRDWRGGTTGPGRARLGLAEGGHDTRRGIPPGSPAPARPARGHVPGAGVPIRERNRIRRPMASNYVDTTGEEGRFHGPHQHHHSASTTPTGAAASSPRTMRRSFSSASSTGGHSHSHGGGGGKCVCAPPTHAGSFKCRLHRTNSQGHGGGQPHPSPPTSPASAAPPAQGTPSSVEAQ